MRKDLLKKLMWGVSSLIGLSLVIGALIIYLQNKDQEIWMSDRAPSELGMARIKLILKSEGRYDAELIILDQGEFSLSGQYTRDVSDGSLILNPGSEESTLFKLEDGCLVSREVKKEAVFRRKWW